MWRGITPAHAGTTLQVSDTVPKSRDHPRSRRNNYIIPSGVREVVGSPPLTREQLFLIGG